MNAQVNAIEMGHGLLPNPVLVKGTGDDTVYLHGLAGQEWDGLLDGLAARRRVLAPAHVGSREPDELRHVDGIFELMLYYDELFDKLGLTQFDLVGHSLGGMVAAEFAAVFPHRVRKLVLIDPLGLWRDDAPVADYLLVTADDRSALLWGDPTSETVKTRLALPEDPEAKLQATLDRVSALAAASHFLWPVPERGLAKRLRRIRAETLVVWGEDDRLVSSRYAKDFADQIVGARVALISQAGHTPQFSQPALVLDSIATFLAH